MNHKCLITTAIASLVGALVALSSATANAQTPQPAQPQPTSAPTGWDYSRLVQPSLGLRYCYTHVVEVGASPGSVNIVVDQKPGMLTVSGEHGKLVRLTLHCVPPTTYTSSLGSGEQVGRAEPASQSEGQNPSGNFPIGRSWLIPIGTQDSNNFLANFSASGAWGTDRFNLTTIGYNSPTVTAQEEIEKYESVGGYNHKVSVGLGPVFGFTKDAGRNRYGIGGHLEAYIKAFGDSPVRLSLGLTTQYDWRYKGVQGVPNLQPVASEVNFNSLYMGGHVGVNFVPGEKSNKVAFLGNARLGFGAWRFNDPTTALSQTTGGKVYLGPAQDETVPALRIDVEPGILLWQTLGLTAQYSYTRALDKITTMRGPADSQFAATRGMVGDHDFTIKLSLYR